MAFHALIQDTLSSLREEVDKQKEWMTTSVASKIEKLPAPIIAEKESAPAQTKAPVQKLASTKEAAIEGMRITIAHTAPSLKWLAPPAQVYLIAFEKNPETMKFLESIAEAINEKLTTASAVYCKGQKEFQELLKTPFLKLVLVLDTTKEVHSIEGKVMTIAPPALYKSDVQLKRALWNLLKSRFMPPSSSTLQSTKL